MVNYTHNIQWRDTSIVLPRVPNGAYNEGEGVFVWSYEGEELGFIDLKKCSMLNSVSSSLALRDSVLYVCGGLEENIQFADTLIRPSGYSIAYMARYVDTAFIMPYGFVDPRVEQTIEWNQELTFALSSSSVTLTAIATSGLPVSYICADTTIAQVIGNQLNLLTAGTTTVTAYQNGNEFGYYPATPVTKTLTINNVGISAVNAEPQIQVYPNPTHGKVSVSSPVLIVSTTLTDMLGRRKEVKPTAVGDGLYSLDLTACPQAIYLLTLVTTDGHRHTIRLLKQSNVETTNTHQQ